MYQKTKKGRHCTLENMKNCNFKLHYSNLIVLKL